MYELSTTNVTAFARMFCGSKGIFAQVEVCPKCEQEWVDEKIYQDLYEQMFTRKTFKIVGSLAIRIPKEITNITGLKEGTDVKIDAKDKKMSLSLYNT